jgi:hypothetical protein
MGNIQIKVHLQTEPKGSRLSETPREAQRRVSRDTSLSVYDLVHSARRDPQRDSELILADAQSPECPSVADESTLG